MMLPITDHAHNECIVIRNSFFFAVSSISMILLNKASISMFPDVFCLLLCQNLTTVLILKMTHKPLIQFKPEIARSWSFCTFLFCVNIGSSLQSLKFISVATFTVLRNTQPLLSCAFQLCNKQKQIKAESLFYLFGVFIGAIVYCIHDLELNLPGFIYATLHVFSMALYSLHVKEKSLKFNLSPQEMSFYNNILSLPLLVFNIILSHSLDSGYSLKNAVSECHQKSECVVILLISCLGGFCVSVTGFQAQNVMSATSWLCLNNVSKIPAILISLVCFGGFYSIDTFHGMFISIICATFYSISNIRAMSTTMHVFALIVMSSSIFSRKLDILGRY